MHYYLYSTEEGRFVALGDDFFLRNVHRVTKDGLQQTTEWIAGRPDAPGIDVDDSMHGTIMDVEERFGQIMPLPPNALVESVRNRDALGGKARDLAREAAVRRFSEPINFIRVPDEVLAVDHMSHEELLAALEEAKERRSKLIEDHLSRYDVFMKRATDRFGKDITLRQYVREARMSFARLENALKLIAERKEREAAVLRYKIPDGTVITWHGPADETGHAEHEGPDQYGFMEQLGMDQKLWSLTVVSDPPAMVMRKVDNKMDFVLVMSAHAKVVGVKLEIVR